MSVSADVTITSVWNQNCFPSLAMGLLRLACMVLLAAACLQAATLERLSFEAMTKQATTIVRGRVGDIRTDRSNGIIYTQYSFEALTAWKGPQVELLEISSSGGTYEGVTQRFVGAPVLEPGAEYVAFLWQGKSARLQILGLAQGLFRVVKGDGLEPYVLRDAIEDVTLVSEQGREIKALRFTLAELETTIRRALAAKETPAP